MAANSKSTGQRLPATLPRTKFDASTDPRDRAAIEGLRRHFTFTDREVERESPSKGRAPPAPAPTAPASVPRMRPSADEVAEQRQLLEFLQQQQASLAALQEKKRRLERAQAEFAKIDRVLTGVISQDKTTDPNELQAAARMLQALSEELPPVSGSASTNTSVAGDDRASLAEEQDEEDELSGSEDTVSEQSFQGDGEDLASKLSILQAKRQQLQALQEQLQTLRAAGAAAAAQSAAQASAPAPRAAPQPAARSAAPVRPVRDAPPPPTQAPSQAFSELHMLQERLAALNQMREHTLQSGSAASQVGNLQDQLSALTNMRQQLESLKSAFQGAGGVVDSQSERSESRRSSVSSAAWPAARPASSGSARPVSTGSADVAAKEQQLKMLEERLGDLYAQQDRARALHQQRLQQLAALEALQARQAEASDVDGSEATADEDDDAAMDPADLEARFQTLLRGLQTQRAAPAPAPAPAPVVPARLVRMASQEEAEDPAGSVDRLQSLLQSLQLQQQKLRQLRERTGRDVDDESVVTSQDGMEHSGDVERQMYLLPGRISPRSGSVSAVSGVGGSSAPTLGTLDMSSRVRQAVEADDAGARGLGGISSTFVMQHIALQQRRMDQITDQLEELNARLAAQPPAPAPAAAAADEDDEGGDGKELQDAVLRGKLELQNVRLASEYVALLPPEHRRTFLSEFTHFFANEHTAGQAFRLALSLLPAAIDAAAPSDAPIRTSTAPQQSRAAAYAVGPASVSEAEFDEAPLFTMVKDDIYRDVALFITANEDRPQFLQDLFGLLQECSTDYLRQRCLNSLQDIVSSVLPDSSSQVGSYDRPPRSAGGASGAGAANRSDFNLTALSTLTNLSSSGIRTRQSVTEPVGYDYDELAADVLSVPTPNEGSSIHSSSAATEDPVFGRDPLAETTVFQPSAGPNGGFDQVLARLDESLRRSALEDRTHYPDDILPSGNESEDGSRTESTVDTSFDDVSSTAGGVDQRVIDSVHGFLATLPADAVLDESIVQSVLKVVGATLDSPPDVALTATLRDSLNRYTGQPVNVVGALAVANLAEIISDDTLFRRVASDVDASYARQLSQATAQNVPIPATIRAAAAAATIPTESDAEYDNKRDDEMAAEGDLPDADTSAASVDDIRADDATPVTPQVNIAQSEPETVRASSTESTTPAASSGATPAPTA
eukprot:m.48428 g.48428  ORF g.48428 m.48428 type:complete len:1184 (+) comp6033_c0_seq1:1-3552(+)